MTGELDRSEYTEFANAIHAITRGGEVTKTDEYIQAVEEVYETDGMSFAAKAALGQRLYGHPEVAEILKRLRQRVSPQPDTVIAASPSSESPPHSGPSHLETNDCTKSGALYALAIVRDEAIKDGDYRAAIQAERTRAEIAGHLVKAAAVPAGGTGDKAIDLSKLSTQELYDLIRRESELTLGLIAAAAPPPSGARN